MRRIILAGALLLFLAGPLLAGSGRVKAPPAPSVQQQTAADQTPAPAGLFGMLQTWLSDLLGLSSDTTDDDADGHDPVFDDGSGSGTGNRAKAITRDNGWVDIID
jgi:hypothetical protein